MTSLTPLAEGRHNHAPHCCCHLELDQGRCPVCPDHGDLADQAEYPCCHQLEGRPHTDYCLNALPSSGEGLPLPEQRPDDDPADEITCNGRNCGGYPHA